ncbi:MAG: amino acid ABC transporter permease [Rhodobacterales bacterium]
MKNVLYVRKEMLVEQSPPPSSIGAVGWVKQNLFNGWFNSILTLISLFLIYSILINLIPWLLSPTWQANSLNECREINNAIKDGGGACWGVITERWPQFIFGFYTRDEIWRPVLVFLFLLITIAPVLIDWLPRKLLLLLVVFPYVAVWLLWGGPVWSPLVSFLGLLLGYCTWHFLKPTANTGEAVGHVQLLSKHPFILVIMTIAIPIVWWSFLATPLSNSLTDIFPWGLKVLPSRNFGGLLLSLTIGVTAIFFSLPIGVLLALGRQSDLLIIKVLCVWFIEFIRGVPLITLLFVASTLLNIFLPPGTNFDIILRVVIMVTLFSAAYLAEVVRGGLAGLDAGQYEGANALGFSYWKAQRLIIMPQALKISIPGIVSTFIGIFKDTTLVSVIGLMDPLGLTTAIRADMAWNGVYWEINIFVAVLFFVFCFSMSRYSMYLERKLQKKN